MSQQISTFCRAAQKSLVYHYPPPPRPSIFSLGVRFRTRTLTIQAQEKLYFYNLEYQLCVDLWSQIKYPSLLSGIYIGKHGQITASAEDRLVTSPFSVLVRKLNRLKHVMCRVLFSGPLIRFQTKTELFCSGYAENDHRKRSHSKTLSRVERFENDAF